MSRVLKVDDAGSTSSAKMQKKKNRTKRAKTGSGHDGCGRIRVHYIGWNKRHDEWVPLESGRVSVPGTW